jgi:hypothetical protein
MGQPRDLTLMESEDYTHKISREQTPYKSTDIG